MINKLLIPDSFKAYYSEYPQGLSLLEAIMDWATKVNLMVEQLNLTNEQIEKLFTDTLPENVETVLNDWYISGKLGDLINIDLIGSVQKFPVLETETGVTNKAFPYGDIRRYGGVGDGVTLDKVAFQNAIASAGKVILEAKSYRIDDVMIQRDNLNFIGQRMPGFKADFSALENGTVLKGTLIVDGHNIQGENFGVDCGIEYTNTFRSGAGGNAFVAHNSPQLGVLNKNNHFKNIVGLARIGDYTDPQAAFHAVLLESLQHGSADNIVGIGGWFGVVFKVSDFNIGDVFGYENDTASVNLKSNTYGPVKNVNIQNIITKNTIARGYAGCLIQASDADLANVNIGNIINEGGVIGTKFEGEGVPSCKNVNIGNIATLNSIDGVKVLGGIYGSIIDNINVNMPTSGVCFDSGPNTVGTPINDLQIGTIRAVAPAGTEAVDHVRLASGCRFKDISCTVGYSTKGNIKTSGRVQVGDYFGKLSANRKASNLANGWTSKFGQEAGIQTKNGRSKGFGRLSAAGASSDVFFVLDASAFMPGLDYYAYALGYDGATSTFGKMIPVLISGGDGSISIPNRGNYADMAWIDLNSIDFPTDLNAIGGV